MSRYRVIVGERKHATQVSVDGKRLSCEVDGEVVSGTLIQNAPPYYALQLDGGRLITCTVTTQGTTTLITSNGQTWSGSISELLGDSLDAEDGDSASSELRAPMPGRVVAVHHDDGATISKGDAIIVIEAMKMQNALTSPRTGNIGKIHIKVGDTVESGQLLVVIV